MKFSFIGLLKNTVATYGANGTEDYLAKELKDCAKYGSAHIQLGETTGYKYVKSCPDFDLRAAQFDEEYSRELIRQYLDKKAAATNGLVEVYENGDLFLKFSPEAVEAIYKYIPGLTHYDGSLDFLY